MTTLLTILLTLVGVVVAVFLAMFINALRHVDASKKGLDDALISGRKNNTYTGQGAANYNIAFKRGMERRNQYRSVTTYLNNQEK